MKLFKTVVILSILFAVTSSAQGIKVGGGLGYGTDINNLGFYVNGVYDFNQNIGASGAFTYFLKKDGLSWYALDVNAEYTFTKNKKTQFYGLAGLNFNFWSFKLDVPTNDIWGSAFADALETSGTEIGLNIGAGTRIALSEKTQLAGEIKYTIGGSEYLMIKAGVLFAL